jgi:hypothetical protein
MARSVLFVVFLKRFFDVLQNRVRIGLCYFKRGAGRMRSLRAVIPVIPGKSGSEFRLDAIPVSTDHR